jgi:hypothetical protein
MQKTTEIILKENTVKITEEVRVKIAQEIRDCPINFEGDITPSVEFMEAMKDLLNQIADFIEEGGPDKWKAESLGLQQE